LQAAKRNVDHFSVRGKRRNFRNTTIQPSDTGQTSKRQNGILNCAGVRYGSLRVAGKVLLHIPHE
jgi:hypothetical protein